jgi:carboxyl-terminal processing protease
VFVFRNRQGKAGTKVLASIDSAQISRERGVSWRIIDKQIGYVRIPSLMPPPETLHDLLAWIRASPTDRERITSPEKAAIREAFEDLRPCRALVLDLRGNVGGIDLLGREIAGHLVNPGYTYGSISARLSSGEWSPVTSFRLPSISEIHVFSGPLAVLVDEDTFSAAENLAAFLQDERPATTVIGRPTGGGSGGPRYFSLTRSGATVVFSTVRFYRPSGLPIEGSGVIPTQVVHWSRRDIETSTDPDLDAAIRYLFSRIYYRINDPLRSQRR